MFCNPMCPILNRGLLLYRSDHYRAYICIDKFGKIISTTHPLGYTAPLSGFDLYSPALQVCQ
jgi:hypothetical protein